MSFWPASPQASSLLSRTDPARRPLRRALLLASLAAALAGPAPGRAQEGGHLTFESEVEASGRYTAEEKVFAWVADPSTPSAGRASLAYVFGLGSGIEADRPLPVDVGSAGPSHVVLAQYGLTGWLAPYVSASTTQSGGTTASGGIKAQLTRPGAPLRFALQAAAVHEGKSGASGARASAIGSLDMGPARLVVNVNAERIFSAGRDKLDLQAMAGASLRVARGVRVGAEYVGQDFEADDAEGGARQVVGPNVAFDLWRGRTQLVVATGFGLGKDSPRALVRAAVSGAF